MDRLLLVAAVSAAAIALPATPAGAQSFVDTGVSVDPEASVKVHRGGGWNRHERRRNRGFEGPIVVGNGWYGDDWAVNNNRSWNSDSFNDWWHDRPDRAYPRWMLNNQDCQRMWWSGGGWRC